MLKKTSLTKKQPVKEDLLELATADLPKGAPEIPTQRLLLNNEHWYPMADETCPYYVSVTKVLSALAKGKGYDQFLLEHTEEEVEEILEDASLAGSKVHEAIAQLLGGRKILPKEFEYVDQDGIKHKGLTAQECFKLKSFTRWFYDFQPKTFWIEKRLYSYTHKVAGTADYGCLINTRRLYDVLKRNKSACNIAEPKTDNEWWFFVLDWKTNKTAIYPSNKMQDAAYAQFEMEMSGIKVHMGGIVRLGTKHKCGYDFQIFDVYNPFKAFLGILATFKYQYPNLQPKFVEIPEYFELHGLVTADIKEVKDLKHNA